MNIKKIVFATMIFCFAACNTRAMQNKKDLKKRELQSSVKELTSADSKRNHDCPPYRNYPRDYWTCAKVESIIAGNNPCGFNSAHLQAVKLVLKCEEKESSYEELERRKRRELGGW